MTHCVCNAYSFPHRPLGGRCVAAAVWAATETEGEACAECSWRRDWVETFPYGDTELRERQWLCTAPHARACPGVREAAGRALS